MGEPNAMDRLQETICRWAYATFKLGPESRVGLLNHIKEEVDNELPLAIAQMDGDAVAEEAADVVIMLFQLCDIYNRSLYKAIERKHAVNVVRKWKKSDQAGVIRHA